MPFIVLITGHKWSHPHGDDQSEMTKRRVHDSRSIRESKKYGYVWHVATEMICHSITV